MHQVNSFFNFLDKGLIQLYFSTDFLLRIREKNPYITQYILSGNPRKLVWSCYIFLNGSSPSVFHLSIYLSDWLVTEWSSIASWNINLLSKTHREFLFLSATEKNLTHNRRRIWFTAKVKKNLDIQLFSYHMIQISHVFNITKRENLKI